jgi:hypothetical protein
LLDGITQVRPFRLVVVLFRSRFEAQLYLQELVQRQAAHLPQVPEHRVSIYDELSVDHGPIQGYAAYVLATPAPLSPEGSAAAPPVSEQQGQRAFEVRLRAAERQDREEALRHRLVRLSLADDDMFSEQTSEEARERLHELAEDADTLGTRDTTDPHLDTWQMLIPDEELPWSRRSPQASAEVTVEAEALLNHHERELTTHWQKIDRRYFASIEEVMLYLQRKGRRKLEEPDEIDLARAELRARAWNQHIRWLEQRYRKQLDSDQAEVASLLATPRRGRKHAEDTQWLTLQQQAKDAGVLRRAYRKVRR